MFSGKLAHAERSNTQQTTCNMTVVIMVSFCMDISISVKLTINMYESIVNKKLSLKCVINRGMLFATVDDALIPEMI